MSTLPAQPLRIGSREGKWVLFATILSSSMSFLDSTVVNVALPTLQRDFRAELSSVAWVVDAYVLTLTAFILLGGSFGDIFGRRRALRLGLIVFTTGSMLCGLAPTLLLLDIARGIQGIGGALLVPSSLAILTASFDPSERGRAIGLWASLSGIGAAIGPLAGGLIVDTISWRGIFFLNLPIAVFVFLVALPKVPESRDEQAQRHIDLPGRGDRGGVPGRADVRAHRGRGWRMKPARQTVVVGYVAPTARPHGLRCATTATRFRLIPR